MKKLLFYLTLILLFGLVSACAEDAPLPDPSVRTPEWEYASSQELSRALEANAFHPEDQCVLPMLVTEKDGRSVLTSGNALVSNSVASVTVQSEANAGDAIVITFKTDTEASADVFDISVNGETVKLFSGSHDWMTYAVPVHDDAVYTVTLSYIKNALADHGEDSVWIDSVRVLSGQAARDALSANPVYPVADEISLMPVDCDAREIAFQDERSVLAQVFGDCDFYLVDADSVTVQAQLTEEIDPEGAFLRNVFEDLFFSMRECAQEDGYRLTQSISPTSEQVLPCTGITLGLYPAGSEVKTVLLFRNEESIEIFLNSFALTGWEFVESANAKIPGIALMSEAAYTVYCVDQSGAPVPGVMLQICDETSCRVAPTDANGAHTFTSAPCAWEVHVLIAPDGYTAADEAFTLPKTGGEITLTLQKN